MKKLQCGAVNVAEPSNTAVIMAVDDSEKSLEVSLKHVDPKCSVVLSKQQGFSLNKYKLHCSAV